MLQVGTSAQHVSLLGQGGIHARKPEMDLIFQLVATLDVDIYGGQRVFIYFVENSKAKDLAATLDSIYGRSASTAARPAALPGGAPPPPIAPPAPALPRIPGVGGPRSAPRSRTCASSRTRSPTPSSSPPTRDSGRRSTKRSRSSTAPRDRYSSRCSSPR